MEIKNKNKLYPGITLFTLTISSISIGLFYAGSTNATTIFYNPHRTNNLELDITRIPGTNTVQHMEIPQIQNNFPLNLGVIGNDYTDYEEEEEEEEEDFLDTDQSLSGINTGDQPQIIPNNQQRRVQTKKEKDKKEDEEEEEEWEEDKNKEDFFDNNFDDDPNDDYFRSYSD